LEDLDIFEQQLSRTVHPGILVEIDACSTRGQFHQYFCPTFSREQYEGLFWQMAFGERQINFANFTSHIGPTGAV